MLKAVALLWLLAWALGSNPVLSRPSLVSQSPLLERQLLETSKPGQVRTQS